MSSSEKKLNIFCRLLREFVDDLCDILPPEEETANKKINLTDLLLGQEENKHQDLYNYRNHINKTKRHPKTLLLNFNSSFESYQKNYMHIVKRIQAGKAILHHCLLPNVNFSKFTLTEQQAEAIIKHLKLLSSFSESLMTKDFNYLLNLPESDDEQESSEEEEIDLDPKMLSEEAEKLLTGIGNKNKDLTKIVGSVTDKVLTQINQHPDIKAELPHLGKNPMKSMLKIFNNDSFENMFNGVIKDMKVEMAEKKKTGEINIENLANLSNTISENLQKNLTPDMKQVMDQMIDKLIPSK